MRAVVLDGQRIDVRDVPTPVAGPGQVLLRVLAAGLCHSDITLARRDPGSHPFSLPLTLGHEVCGSIEAMPTPIPGLRVGEAVAVHGPRGCGECTACIDGQEQYCPHARPRGIWPIGLGRNGGLAEYLLIDDPDSLVPLSGVDPIAAAPLTDAGLTSYAAIMPSLERLGPDQTCVVIGIGGLGHLAVQILRHVSPSRIIAVDRAPQKMTWAIDLGADAALLMDNGTATAVREMTDGVGADVILDFVGSPDSTEAALDMLAVAGEIVLVGVGTGIVPVSIPTVPLGTRVRTTYWGSREDLVQVIDLAKSGVLRCDVETVTLEEVTGAYERMDAGTTRGRVVAIPAVD